MRIAVLGLGTVGQHVVSLLLGERELFAERLGEDIEVARILVRDRHKPRPADLRHLLTTDPEDVFSDSAIEMVVELMGGQEPAQGYMARALASGRSVVTANKEVIAAGGPALSRLAAPGATLLFEAAVAGGIPIVRALQESLQGNRIRSIHGIVNGATNFLLTRMHETGDPFSSALAEAKALGFLEADPSDDLDGVDAARKIAILAGLSFGGWFPLDAVQRTGIRGVSAADVRAAQEIGGVIKLIARAEATAEGVRASVEPTLLGPGHPLAGVDGPQNAVYVQGEPIGEVLLAGLGAGGASTSSAVAGDILASARMRRLGGRPPQLPVEPVPVLPPGSGERAYAVRLLASPEVGKSVRELLARSGFEMAALEQTADLGPLGAEHLLVTKPGDPSVIRRSLDSLPAGLAVQNCLVADWERPQHGAQ